MEAEVENREKRKGRPRPRPVTSSHYKVDTKGTCLLCFRECGSRKFRGQSSLLEAKRKEKDLSILFCKLLLRHLKVKFQRNIAQPSNLKLKTKIKTVAIELCEDCSLMASNFCEMYHNLEVLKIRLHGCLQTLSKIMRTAGRIPSRLRAYHDKMGVESQTPKGAKSQSGNPTSATVPVTPRPSAFVLKKRRIAVNLAENFRKELIRKLLQKSRDISPIVRVTKPKSFDQSSSTISKTLTTIATPAATSSLVPSRPLPSWNLQNMIFAYYASVISFPLVLWLATYNDSGNCRKFSAPPNHGDSIVTSISPEKPVKPPQEEIRRHSITITDSGNTVMLPHQNFKMAGDAFVDESMDYECGGDLINLEDDAFLGPNNPVTVDISADIIDNHNQDELAAAAGTIHSQLQLMDQEILEMEVEPESTMMEEESILDLNDKTCTECQIELSCRAEVEKHRALIHKTSNYVQCPACKKMLASYQALKGHRIESESCGIDEASEHAELEYIARPLFPYASTIRGNNFCPLEGCFEVFLKSENLQLHLKAHGQWSCEFCPEKFEKAHDLALHECSEHSGNDLSNGYKCTRCNVHVVAQHNFIVHFLETHLKLELFADRCQVCQKGFLSSQKILKDVHFKTYHDVEGKPPQSIFKCDLCEAPFLKKTQLNQHKMHVHNLGQQEKMYRCTVCDLELISQRVLLRHKLTEHTNLEKHEIQAQLKRKTQNQNNRKKYECHCGLTFTTKFNLVAHSKIHEQLDKDIAKHQKEYEEQQRLQAEQEKTHENLETSKESE